MISSKPASVSNAIFVLVCNAPGDDSQEATTLDEELQTLCRQRNDEENCYCFLYKEEEVGSNAAMSVKVFEKCSTITASKASAETTTP